MLTYLKTFGLVLAFSFFVYVIATNKPLRNEQFVDTNNLVANNITLSPLPSSSPSITPVVKYIQSTPTPSPSPIANVNKSPTPTPVSTPDPNYKAPQPLEGAKYPPGYEHDSEGQYITCHITLDEYLANGYQSENCIIVPGVRTKYVVVPNSPKPTITPTPSLLPSPSAESSAAPTATASPNN